MESLLSYVHTHQFAVIATVIIALIAIYFLLKNLVKLALITVVILIVVGAYFYLTAPKKSPHDIIRAWKKVKGDTVSVVEKGKTVLNKGKEIVKKGEKVSQDVANVLKPSAEEKAKKDSPPSRERDTP